MGVTDLSKVRDERTPVCEFCGKQAHKGEYECPRIQSITHSPETGEITIRFSVGFLNIPSD